MKPSYSLVIAAIFGAFLVYGSGPSNGQCGDLLMFKCPGKYGVCNDCIYFGGSIVALTRKLCKAKYSQHECKHIYHGAGGICDDGCNQCSCTPTGLRRTT